MSRALLMLALLLPLSAGCSSKPKLVAVRGTVTFDGKPAAETGVAFWPADPNAPLVDHNNGLIVTDAAGNFSLESQPDAGFAPGEYKITFTRVIGNNGRPTPYQKPGEDGAKESVPEKYRDRQQTPVSVVLTAPSTALEFSVPAR